MTPLKPIARRRRIVLGIGFFALFAAWGLGQVTVNALSVLALVRYRALVPFMFLLLLTEHLARKLIFVVLPMARIGADNAPGFYINVAIVAVMVVGLALSLRPRSRPPSGR